MLIAPDMDPEYVRETVRRQKFVGLKPYHTMAGGRPHLSAIEAFFGRRTLCASPRETRTTTLYAVLDSIWLIRNQVTIRRYCEEYLICK